ncbi:DUF1489 domain-containing protein [uncultured Paracoccus sp.]|uniref:DUF1489 family protein n=1 Tax=uncultured Paracoccus sp. TaxID=189685 RepID=UPI0026334709|nr:DUF1489 domain-containing protein [uncultured Paracoccus sp.]
MSPAPLNLMKLCVGADAPEDLLAWQQMRFGGGTACHVTRMWPKREDELLQGGSLYWVFKGVMSARQRLIGLEERIGEDGIRRCALMLDPDLIRVTAVPRRPFQGWRYLNGAEAPIDLPRGAVDDTPLPPEVAARLAEMGLI